MISVMVRVPVRGCCAIADITLPLQSCTVYTSPLNPSLFLFEHGHPSGFLRYDFDALVRCVASACDHNNIVPVTLLFRFVKFPVWFWMSL